MALASIAFPFRVGVKSFPEVVFDQDVVMQSLVQIVITNRGERVMRPDFGTRVLSLLFEGNNATLAEEISADVMTAVGKFEPRVIVKTVDVVQDEETGATTLTLNYIDRITRTAQQVEMSFSGG